MSLAANRILAIDGPAGAGKSTVATRMARMFGLLNIETGAMYRAFALKALRRGEALGDAAALSRLSETTAIRLAPGTDTNRVFLDEEDVTARLRTPEVAEAASQLSVHPPVRAWLVGLQQAIGRTATQGVVMEGRDIGTVVFPDASLKIFLSASPEARSQRRLLQNGAGVDAAVVLEAVRARDARDTAREASPLRAANDAVVIDSTALTLDAVTSQIAALACERWNLAGQNQSGVIRDLP